MSERTQRLVAAMALDQELAANILRTHVADENGRCAGCAVDTRLRPAIGDCGARGIAVLARLPQQRGAG